MKKRNILTLLFSLICGLTVSLISSCENTKEQGHIDYASELKLDMNSNRARLEVTVHNYVDGDTTHFKTNSKTIPDDGSGILKARYNAIDTPESTGKVEEWGKTASNFTHDKLAGAESIIIESDEEVFKHDSTGERYLCWVWYKTKGASDYRLLNLEIVQEGYSMVKNAESSDYGKIISKAYAQAMAEKIHLFGEEKDENYYYGEAMQVSIKELRDKINDYLSVKVIVNGYVTRLSGQYVYIQDYDTETEKWYGFTVYKGFNCPAESIIKEGQYMRFVGNVMYYETGDSYQISGLSYIRTRPNNLDNTKVLDLSEFNGPIDSLPEVITYSEVVARGDSYVSGFVKVNNLTVVSTYTTNNGGDSDGAISIKCTDQNGQTFTVRTVVLTDENNVLVTSDYFEGNEIDVSGIIEKYNGEYQIKLVRLTDVTVKEK